ncbi:MAG: glycoside hydrolase family 32 protein [Fimbriimonadaceae bacterium]
MIFPTPIIFMQEPLRPQLHFTAPKGWLNDPNGLVYRNGEYHLFYQHNPFGTQWGNMTWGHAVSKDLLHWRDLPNAIEPDALGTIFSGSAVIDRENTSGLGSKSTPAMVCFYTAAGGTSEASKGQPFTQCLAWSQDGTKFTKLPANPIVGHIADQNRDPKVAWDDEHKKWVMVLYLTADKFAFLGSKNLRKWERLSELQIPNGNECPDFFQLTLGGKKKWVFWTAQGKYMIGTFDGDKFHPETPVIDSHFGNTGYAAQTYSNIPRGRVVQIAWMNNAEFPGCVWNQQMALPNELKLKATAAGPRLAIMPVGEVRSLRKGQVGRHGTNYEVPSGLMDIEGSWRVPKSGSLICNVNGTDIKLDAAKGTLSALDKSASVDLSGGKFNLRIIVDRTSMEIYAQDGLVSMSLFALPRPVAKGAELSSEGQWDGQVKVYELGSVWGPNQRTER